MVYHIYTKKYQVSLLIKICVSIAAKCIEELADMIQNALSQNADYVEIRFDYLDEKEIDKALRLSETISERAIFTLRPVSEGGNFHGTVENRVSLLEKIGLSKPMLLDVELDTIKSNHKLIEFFSSNKISLLISWHDFFETPSDSELVNKVTEMKKYSNYVKIVTTAINSGDVLRIIELYNTSKDVNLIAFAMGEIGILSRLFCNLYGNAPFTYAALDKPTALGQLNIKTMRKLYAGVNKKLSGNERST